MTPNLTGRLGVPGPRGDVWERDLTHLTESVSRHVGELGGGGWGVGQEALSPVSVLPGPFCNGRT